MRRAFVMVLSAAGIICVTAWVVFAVGTELGWLDALYFVVTTMTTVGYGDINLLEMPAGLKVFGMFVELAGAAAIAATFGLVTDFIVRTRLQRFFGRRIGKMKDHIVLCGLGNVGSRTLAHLRELGEEVVVVEKDEECRFLAQARHDGVPLITGDIRNDATLDQARVAEASCIVAASNDDLANLEAVLHAREVNPDIRVVMRLFDQTLAKKVESGFGITSAFSTSYLAAPAFAMAAVDEAVVGSCWVGETLLLNVALTVGAGTTLEGLTVGALERKARVSVLHLAPKSGGEAQFHPADDRTLAAGDTVVVSATRADIPAVKALNES